MLSINAGAFSALAALRVGSTLRSLLNLTRLVAVLWVLLLTVAVRSGGVPGLGAIVDDGLKACVVWLTITTVFAFVIYPAVDDSTRRSRFFGLLTVAGFIAWTASLALESFGVAELFARKIGN